MGSPKNQKIFWGEEEQESVDGVHFSNGRLEAYFAPTRTQRRSMVDRLEGITLRKG